jgi:lipopolysaccharide transport system permease protein
MLGSAGFHLLVSLGVWLAFYCMVFGLPHWTLLQLPLAVLPLALLTLGASWLLAALGVYLRDVAQVVGVATAVLMFLSPIFYPVSALPPGFRAVVELSPLTFAVEQSRNVMIWGTGLEWARWAVHTVQGALVAWVGYACFQKVRRGFADVL